jgi:hypothetical protein
MNRTVRVSGVLLLALLGACTEDAGSVSTAEPDAGERLLGDAPAGWKRVQSSVDPGIRIVEYIPEDQDPDTWTEKITFESFSGAPLPDPIEFLKGMSTDQAGACPEHETFPTFSGLENGYPTSVQLMICNRSRLIDQSQVTMIKAIRGNDYFYVIARARRGEPLEKDAPALSEEEAAGWSLFLRSIRLCDSTDEGHACPAP